MKTKGVIPHQVDAVVRQSFLWCQLNDKSTPLHKRYGKEFVRGAMWAIEKSVSMKKILIVWNEYNKIDRIKLRKKILNQIVV